MLMTPKFDRGHLRIDEQQALFRQGLKDELARATAHITAPIGAARTDEHNHKIMAAAYRIVARVTHDTPEVGSDAVMAEIDETWSEQEVRLLGTVLRVLVTPMSISRTDALESIEALGIPVNDGTCTEARSQLLRGYAEAHSRVEEALHFGLN
ncbi:MAG: hypothetical protein KKH37_01435, partial [Alphaproteobacteria bacterium]|nr:hypothetical protein [Alphaproteobacteria bacterium]